MSTTQLERELSSPSGQLACPKPQYTNADTGEYEALQGKDGATFCIIKSGENLAVVTASGELLTKVNDALPAGDNNIGNVDIASMPVTHIIADSGTVGISGVVHVDDNSSTLSVDDGNGSLTVDGTVAVSSLPALPAGNAKIGKFVITDGTHDADVNADGTIDVFINNWPATFACTQSGTWNITGITNVVHVDDNSSTLSVDDGNGSLTVDGTVAVSSLPTLPAGDNNIGNVDVVTMPITHVIADSGTVGVSGVVHVDDNASSLTVDNPQLTGVYDTTTHYLGVAVANIPHVVIDSLPNVTLNSLPEGAAHIGEVAVNSLPAVNIGTMPTVVVSSVPAVDIASGTITYITNVVHVDDNGASISIDDAEGSITVDGSVSVSSLPALPAGTNKIGSVDITRRQATATPTASTVSIGTSATALPASPLTGRHTVWITNPSTTVSVYLTDASGNISLELFPQDKIPMPVADETVLLFAKVASGSQNVYVMELK